MLSIIIIIKTKILNKIIELINNLNEKWNISLDAKEVT
jgi:hypothetical protein